MLKILVNATANDFRGPLSLTKDFIYDLKRNETFLKVNKIHVTVLISNKEINEINSGNITIKYDYTPKKSFAHKLFYEYFYLPKLMQRKNMQGYLSLQNTGIKKGDYQQFVLVQTSLLFDNLSIKDLELKNYIKYRVILRNIFRIQVKTFEKLIVQTHWIKEKCIDFGIEEQKIIVQTPKINNFKENNRNLSPEVLNNIDPNTLNLLYPTNKDKYKNNSMIIKAIEEYNQKYHNKITLYVTIEGVNKPYIKYIGKVKYESMFTLYNQMDGLAFASLTETLGLPLIEAKQASIPILVSDRNYSREICGEEAYYFNPHSINSIINCLDCYASDVSASNKSSKKYYQTKRVESDYTNYFNFIKLMLESK